MTKRFDAVAAAEDVSFDLRSGEVHALVGENGAGKSTLMKIVAGVHAPDTGTLRVGGEQVSFSRPYDAERAGIAMIPQELELFGELSVAENLYVGRRRPRSRWGGFDWSAMRAEARRVFRSLGIEIDVSWPVKRLPIATQQTVAIARALLGDARIVIMDEPTAALTEQEAERLFALIGDLTARGVGIVYISHRLEEIFAVSQRITVMRDGRHVRTAPVGDLDIAELVRLMVGRPLTQLFSRERGKPGRTALALSGLTRPGAFEDVDLDVRHGEVVGLAGLIGAGRTELAHAVFGIEPAASGEIQIDGERASIHSPEAALSHGIAYVPEERRSQGLILPFSITRNISFSSLTELSRWGLVKRREETELGTRFADVLGIKGAPLVAPVTRLSGGNQQKVVVAKALARAPKILILDEPTRGVDVGAKAEIYRLIDALAQDGMAVLLISSEMVELLAMSDRVVVMHQGRVATELSREDATQERVIAAATGVTEMMESSRL